MILKVVNETEDGKIELIEFSPTMKDSEIVSRIVDGAPILRPLESTDEDGKDLWEKDIIEFEYEEDYENKKYKGFLAYEECMWIVMCEAIPDGYIEVRDLVKTEADCHWVKSKKIGNKYTHPNLLEEYED